jgi:hypothetical protein
MTYAQAEVKIAVGAPITGAFSAQLKNGVEQARR